MYKALIEFKPPPTPETVENIVTRDFEKLRKTEYGSRISLSGIHNQDYPQNIIDCSLSHFQKFNEHSSTTFRHILCTDSDTGRQTPRITIPPTSLAQVSIREPLNRERDVCRIYECI